MTAGVVEVMRDLKLPVAVAKAMALTVLSVFVY